MDYLKLFQTHEEYEAFVSGGTMLRPNVSHCVAENEVHYNPIIPPQPLIVRYNVADASNPTRLYSYEVTGALLFDKVEVDGTEVSITDLDVGQGYYPLAVGEHTVRYTLKDPTVISQKMFKDCVGIVSVTLDNRVTTIERYAFGFCDNLETINIPDSITTIENYSFARCNHSLDSDIAAIIYSFNNQAFKWEK